MATPSHRLNHELTARIVTEWRERLASYFSLSCNIVHRPHEFVPMWDMISIERAPPYSLRAGLYKPLSPLLVLREAVEIWHAVSCCAGFGFHENSPFWEHALRVNSGSRCPTVPLAITESFPVLVMHWDSWNSFGPYLTSSDCESIHDDNSPQRLGFHFGAFFGMLGSDSTTRSIDHQANLREIRPFVQSSRMEAVPIRVKLRFGVEKSTSQALLAWLSTDYQTIYDHLQSPPQRSRLDPGVMLLGLQLVVEAAPNTLHFKWLHQLLARMPESIPVEFVLHPLASDKVMAQRDMLPLLESMMGKLGGPAGRLELLDLSSGGKLTNVGAVCSLLPHSRSIVEVRLTLHSTLGFLWVVYAMFHPASRHTKWTRLHLGDSCIDTIELQIMRRFLGSQNGSEVFRCIASSAEKYVTEYPAALGPPATESFGTPRGYVIRLATLAKRTEVYAVSRPAVARCTAKQTKSGTRVYPTAVPGTMYSHTLGGFIFLSETAERTATEPIVSKMVLATLPKGTQVELAENDPSNLPEKVHVVVAGCGLGVVPKAHLKEITTQEYSGCRTSCITALRFKSFNSNEAAITGFLQELLPNLRHMRVNPPLAFLEGSVTEDGCLAQNSMIESVDGYKFSARSFEWMERLHRLHSIGLRCTADQLLQLDSAIRSAFTGDAASSRSPLRALRLTVDGPSNSKVANWELALTLLSTTISQELKGLRAIEIEFSEGLQLLEEVDQFTAQLPPSQPGLAMGKRTFLWALHTWRPQCAAALDSYVTAMIFAYCGRSMERVVIT